MWDKYWLFRCLAWMGREDKSRKAVLNSEELLPHKRCFATLLWRQICGISKDGVLIPVLNQAFTLSAVLRCSSPYSLYCLVAARLPSRAHLDLEMELPVGWSWNFQGMAEISMMDNNRCRLSSKRLP
jgi:hypothetical protein